MTSLPEEPLDPPPKRTRSNDTAERIPPFHPADDFLVSPPHSIRSRLFKLCFESDWSEVLAVTEAIAAKRREIEVCEHSLASEPNDDLQVSLETLRQELEDWTWPSSLVENPRHAWNRLSRRKGAKERLLQDPARCREAGWIVLQPTRTDRRWFGEVQRDLWGVPDSFLRRDPAFLRACLDMDEYSALDVLGSVPLVPTPEIVQDQDLVRLIVKRFPTFLRHEGIPSEFFADRDLFEAAVQGILHSGTALSCDSDVLCLFSEALRNDFDLALSTLQRLRNFRRLPGEPSFVGPTLCDDADFCVRATVELAIPPPPLKGGEDPRFRTPESGSRRLLDLSDVSERLRHESAVVVTAFCRLDAANLALALETWQSDANVCGAACDAHPAAIWHAPPCPTRSALVSSVPFVVRLLKESAPDDLDQARFETLPTSIREDWEVSLAAATAMHTALTHPRWHKSIDFWCEAIRRTEADLQKRFDQIPYDLWREPRILDAISRQPLAGDWNIFARPPYLFKALLRRVSDRESLLNCVRYAQGFSERRWRPSEWSGVPGDLWEDKALCLEVLAINPVLYGCLAERLKSDADILTALLTAEADHWTDLLCLIPVELQLQRPDLVVSLLDKCLCSNTVVDAVAPALWHNPKVVMAIFRCYNCRLPFNSHSLRHFDNDEDLWLQVAAEHDEGVYGSLFPYKFRSDRTFLLRLVRANPERCLEFLPGDPPLDIDLILAACAAQPQFADTFVDRCLCRINPASVRLSSGGYYMGYRLKDYEMDEELRLLIPCEVRQRTSRYLSFLYFLRWIGSAGAVAVTATESGLSPPPEEPPWVRAPLTLLNQGSDMVQVYQALLAAYLGFPSVDEELATELSGLKRLTVAVARRGL